MIIQNLSHICDSKAKWGILIKHMDIQNEVEKIKEELADLIVAYLRESKIEVGKAQQLAADFLKLLPVNDQKDLLTKLKQLSDNYVEVRDMYLREITKANEVAKDEALTQMRNAIAQGNIEHAISVAKVVNRKENI